MELKLNFRSLYFDDVDSWTVLYPPTEAGVFRRIIAGPMHCREELTGDLIAAVNYGKTKNDVCKALVGYNGKAYLMLSMFFYSEDLVPGRPGSYYNDWITPRRSTNEEEKKYEVKLEKASLKEHKKIGKKIKDAVNLLNYFEGKAGWSKSKLIIGPYFAKNIGERWFESSLWVFEVNNRWMVSSHMLSMLILILRSGMYYLPKTIKRFANGHPWKDLLDKNELSEVIECPYELQSQIEEVARYWIPLLKNYEDVFKGHKSDPVKFWRNVSSSDGIYNLFNGWADRDSVAERAQQLKPLKVRRCAC